MISWGHSGQTKAPADTAEARWLPLLVFGCALMVVAITGVPAAAQGARQKLPAAEKIVSAYLKAIGGRKRVASIRDATYEWSAQRDGQEVGRITTRTRAAAYARIDAFFSDGETSAAAGPRSAWLRWPNGALQTLTEQEAGAAKLQAALDASHLVDYKKLGIMARTIGLDDAGAEPAYIIEFSTRNGAHLRYWFGASSNLLLQIADEARRTIMRFGDYRAAGGVLEPHRVERMTAGAGPLALVLQSTRYNLGLDETLFDPPNLAALDIPALLREVERNQDEIEARVDQYTFTRKETQREVNDRGEVTKETVKVYEVYPVPGQRPIIKLVSENGTPLSPERAEKEQKRVAEELEKAERERARRAQKREQERAQRKEKGEDDDEIGISDFLRVCELVSARRERFRDRDAVVFDFRPRPNFRPRNRAEAIISKLDGIAWIDPVDKVVIRLEARLAEGYKMGGGLVASIRQGSAFAFEQTRMPDGVWLPRYAQINASFKLFLLAGGDFNITREYGDYRRFDTFVGEDKIEGPKAKPEER